MRNSFKKNITIKPLSNWWWRNKWPVLCSLTEKAAFCCWDSQCFLWAISYAISDFFSLKHRYHDLQARNMFYLQQNWLNCEELRWKFVSIVHLNVNHFIGYKFSYDLVTWCLGAILKRTGGQIGTFLSLSSNVLGLNLRLGSNFVFAWS